MIYMCLSNNPSSGDINSTNLSCLMMILIEKGITEMNLDKDSLIFKKSYRS